MALKRAVVTETTTSVTPEDKVAMAAAQAEASAALEAKEPEAAQVEGAVVDKEPEVQAAEVVEAQVETQVQTAEVKSDEAAEAQASKEPESKPRESQVQAEEVQHKQVVIKPSGNTAVANSDRTKGAAAEFTKNMAEQGFEGMELTGMSFDRLKMHEGKFQLGSEEISLGEEIHVNIMSTRNIYVVRQHSGQKAEMYYSYDADGENFTDGSSAAETRAEWLDDGYGTPDEPLQIKQYIEGMAQLVNRDDEYEGHMVSLSIPPASKQRLSGAFAVGMRKYSCLAGDLIIKCSVGKKIGTGDEAFRPWLFAADGMMGA